MKSQATFAAWMTVVVAGGCTALVGLDDEYVLLQGEETSGGGSGSAGSTSGSCGNEVACSPKDPQCNLGSSCCIALVDNKDAALAGLRMAQLTLTKPAVLAPGSIVGNIIADGVQMNLDKCNLTGGGTFSWLLVFDTVKGKLMTGGAMPTDDPLGGYCFVTQSLGGVPITPIYVDSGLSAGSFSANVGDIVIPIFLDETASSFVLLPLKQTVLTGTLSTDNNCVGKYNAEKLDPGNNCLAEPPDTLQFVNAGTLDSFITLEDADMVIVDSLKQSLCVLLSGNAAMYGDGTSPNKCKRDMNGKIEFQGDWCEATNAVADAMCSDSVKLGGEFAASAVKVIGICI